MNLLDKALELAQDFHVFPLIPNGKTPAVKDWENWATQEQSEIILHWGRFPDANIGIACGPSDLIVLDVDNKNGKDGSASLFGIELVEGATPTYSVKTPNAGFHHYYWREGVDLRNTAGGFGEGLDTRAIGGFVVGEGSILDGVPYVWDYEKDGGDVDSISKISTAPEWLLKQPKRAEIIQTVEKEASPVDHKRAVHYLQTCEPAIEGENGDTTTFNVACQVRDFGIEQGTCLALMLGFYNPRCEPEWGFDELQEKIDNAYNYAQNSKGAKSLTDMFEDLTEKDALIPCLASDIDLNLPARDWVLGHRLITGFVTVTVAPGGVGKSMYTMLEALAVATGRPLLGEVPRKTGPVVIYNTEDPLDEIQRRILAICLHYSIPLDELNNVHILSGVNDPLKLAETIQGQTKVTRDNERLANLVKSTKAVLISVDPFVATHMANENDNGAMDIVIRCFKNLAILNRCSVSIVHHTRKLPAGTGVGDANAARGASSIIDAARVSHTITTMCEKEAKQLGIPESERFWYVRIDNAKGNMSAPASGAKWLRKVSVKLPNGDSVGTLEPIDLSDRYLDSEIATRLEAEQLASGIYTEFGIGEHKLATVSAWMATQGFEGGSSKLRRIAEKFFENEPVVTGEIKVVYRFRENGTPKHGIIVSLI